MKPTTAPVGQPMFTVATTGRLLDLTPYQVRKLIDAGELPSEDIGDRTFILAESVREYAERSREPTP